MKTISILLLFFTSLLLTAQNWCPGGAAWHYTVSHGQTAGYQNWHKDADTVIHGINCSIVRGMQYLTTIGLGDTAVTPLGTVYTYALNDTAYLFDTAFYPAYYWNSQVGDTIYTRNMGSSGLALVDSNDKLVFNGDTLRFYVFHLLGSCADSPSSPFKVIERIGGFGTSFIPSWNCSDSNLYYYSLCNYRDSSFAVYPDSATNCTSLSITLPLAYHHLLDTTNIWHTTQNGCAVLLPHGSPARSQSCLASWQPPALCYTGTDTLVDSIHYLILYAGAQPYTCIAGFMREDTFSGKVYFRDNSTDPEILLYDFSMRAGDSVYLAFQDMTPSNYTGYWYLTSTSVVTTPAGPRYAFYLTRNGEDLTWLEGVGSTFSPVYLYYQPGFSCGFFESCNQPYGLTGYDNRTSLLTCFSHSSLVYFDNCAYQSVLNLPQYSNCSSSVIDSCDYEAICGALNDIAELSSFSILPNPANNQVNIQLQVKEADKFKLLLRDLQGKAVLASNNLGWLSAGEHSAVINLDNLSPGFYLVECHTATSSLYRKLVVEH